MLCVVAKEKLLCLGSKRGHDYKSVVTNIVVCVYTQDCVLNLEESGSSDSQPVRMFLLLTSLEPCRVFVVCVSQITHADMVKRV